MIFMVAYDKIQGVKVGVVGSTHLLVDNVIVDPWVRGQDLNQTGNKFSTSEKLQISLKRQIY